MRGLWLCVAVGLIGVQFLRFDTTPTAADGELAAPHDVNAVLHTACYDCHSNRTVWPWYGYVAPVAWLLERDVRAGRQRLNFSEWDAYASDPDTARHKLDEIRAAIAAGDMAPWYYRLLHADARLSATQRDRLIDWARSAAATLPSS
jgi:hypothetical protein